MNKFTKREKVLMYIAFILALLAGGYHFLMKPLKQGYEEVLFAYEQKQLEEAFAVSGLREKEALKNRLDSYYKYHEIHKEDFSLPLNNMEIESEIVSYLEGTSFRLTNTFISEPIYKEFGGESEEEQAILLESNITLGLEGSIEDLKILLDRIHNETTMEVLALTMDEVKGKENQFKIQMTISYYMMESYLNYEKQ